MTRAEILSTAAIYVTADRAATHGSVEDNFAKIAALWSAYMGFPFSPVDVGALMSLLKLARAKGNPGHADNWIDLAGYAACAGEIATKPVGISEGISFEEHMRTRRAAGVTIHADGETTKVGDTCIGADGKLWRFTGDEWVHA